MTALQIDTFRVFQPLLKPARYRAAWGGRGSGKSHFFAGLLVEECLLVPGTRAVCIREVQKTLQESSKRLIDDTIDKLGVAHLFKQYRDRIITPGDGVIIFMGMQDATADSIKSLEGYRIAWWEEAQSASERSLAILQPTMRAPGSQIWFSWNPRRKTDPVDKLLRGSELPTDAIVVEANWRDNPMLSAELEQERLDCLRINPDQYPHIWEGKYAALLHGAYYAAAINKATDQGRIGRVVADPLLRLGAYVDIGGTGASSDSFVIWIAQIVGREIRVLNYYEAQGQPLAAHINWLRSSGYEPHNLRIYLPHDGAHHDKLYGVTYESALVEAGWHVTVVPNQGRGAALQRVEVARRIFDRCWFNAETTQPGIDALGWYHERYDASRQIGLGPEHDWASHGADAFGLMAVVVESEIKSDIYNFEIDYSRMDRACI